jgi:hypothetical protein
LEEWAVTYRVEIFQYDAGTKILEEGVDIAADGAAEARQVMEDWLAGRGAVLYQATHVRLLDEGNEIYSRKLGGD